MTWILVAIVVYLAFKPGLERTWLSKHTFKHGLQGTSKAWSSMLAFKPILQGAWYLRIVLCTYEALSSKVGLLSMLSNMVWCLRSLVFKVCFQTWSSRHMQSLVFKVCCLQGTYEAWSSKCAFEPRLQSVLLKLAKCLLDPGLPSTYKAWSSKHAFKHGLRGAYEASSSQIGPQSVLLIIFWCLQAWSSRSPFKLDMIFNGLTKLGLQSVLSNLDFKLCF